MLGATAAGWLRVAISMREPRLDAGRPDSGGTDVGARELGGGLEVRVLDGGELSRPIARAVPTGESLGRRAPAPAAPFRDDGERDDGAREDGGALGGAAPGVRLLGAAGGGGVAWLLAERAGGATLPGRVGSARPMEREDLAAGARTAALLLGLAAFGADLAGAAFFRAAGGALSALAFLAGFAALAGLDRGLVVARARLALLGLVFFTGAVFFAVFRDFAVPPALLACGRFARAVLALATSRPSPSPPSRGWVRSSSRRPASLGIGRRHVSKS
jgi:hypothetical protein